VGLEDATYEWLRSEISSLKQAPDPSSRRLDWVTSDHSLAVSRDAEGRLEVFVAGKPLSATTKTVADLLEHQVWNTDEGTDLAATRVVLPRGAHFDQFGAFLCVELVEHGLEDNPQVAFSAVEPLIALALEREIVTDQTLMGLIGELALLESLLVATSPDFAPDVLRSWAGSTPTARDFQLGAIGVEVKTTQGSASVHHVQGVHQVELGHSNDGVAETALFLLSLGIGWLTYGDQGRSLPALVDSILDRLMDVDDRLDFLARIKQYGGDAALGYDHHRDRGKARYSTRFYFRFERLYDMSDDRLKLLTSAHLAGLANVDPSSVSFRVVLNDRIRGEHNPVKGWSALTSKLLSAGELPVV